MNKPSQAQAPATLATQVAILDALPALIALIDPQGVIVAVNEAWRKSARINGARAAQAGVRHFLTKPYAAKTILAELPRILAGPPSRGSRPPA